MKITCVVIYLVTFFLLPNISFGDSCNSFYKGQLGNYSYSLLELVKARLAADTNGFPEYVVGQTLAQDLSIVTQKYQATMAQIASKGPNNKASFALQTVSAVLDNFSRLAISLGRELDKEKRDLKKIKQDSEELQTCFGNIRKCESNLPIAVKSARENLLQSKQLVFELEKKKQNINELALNLVNLNDLPNTVLESLDRTLKTQARLVDSYLDLLKSAVEVYEQIETQLRVQTPEIQTALLEIAILQSKGAKIDGGLEMSSANSNSSSIKLLSADGHSFVTTNDAASPTPTPMGIAITSDFFNSPKSEKGSLALLGEKINLQKKLVTTYNDVLNVHDIEVIIRTLMLHPDFDYKTIFAPKFFDGIGEWRISPDVNGSNVHFFLFMIDGFNPVKYRDSIQWLISLLSTSLTEVKESDLRFIQKRLRVHNIEKMIKGYQKYINSNDFNSDLDKLLNIKGKEKIRLSYRWGVFIPVNFTNSR